METENNAEDHEPPQGLKFSPTVLSSTLSCRPSSPTSMHKYRDEKPEAETRKLFQTQHAAAQDIHGDGTPQHNLVIGRAA